MELQYDTELWNRVLGLSCETFIYEIPRTKNFSTVTPVKKEKKADYEALHSPLMRIPRIDVATVRDLIDLGFVDTYELAGRSPEALFESLKAKKPQTPIRRLHYFRMTVYFAETDDPDPKKLNPQTWAD